MLRLENRTTVLVDEHPLWLDTVEQVVADLGVQVIGKATRASEALTSSRSIPRICSSRVSACLKARSTASRSSVSPCCAPLT